MLQTVFNASKKIAQMTYFEKIGDQTLLLGSKRLFVDHQSYHNLDSGLFMPQNIHWNKYQNSS